MPVSFFVNNKEEFILNFYNCSTVKFNLGHNNLSLLVDTGASLCVLKYEVLEKFPYLLKDLIQQKLTIRGVSGKLDSEGYLDLSLSFNGVLFFYRFYVF